MDKKVEKVIRRWASRRDDLDISSAPAAMSLGDDIYYEICPHSDRIKRRTIRAEILRFARQARPLKVDLAEQAAVKALANRIIENVVSR